MTIDWPRLPRRSGRGHFLRAQPPPSCSIRASALLCGLRARGHDFFATWRWDVELPGGLLDRALLVRRFDAAEMAALLAEVITSSRGRCPPYRRLPSTARCNWCSPRHAP